MGRLGLTPSEFYAMTPEDFWWLLWARCPDMFTAGVDYDALYDLLD